MVEARAGQTAAVGSAVLLGASVAAAVALLLWWAGAFSSPQLPPGFGSQEQLLGMNLALMLGPGFLLGARHYLAHRSRWLALEVEPLLDEEVPLSARLRPPTYISVIGVALGVLYAVAFNLPVATFDQLRDGGPLLMTLVAGMIFLWVSAGFVVASRLYVSSLFRRAGEQVPIDPFDLAPLEPFARLGMADMLLAVLALVVSTVQSIDANFRYQNYLYALLVAVPVASVLLVRPMGTIHARLKTRRASLLAEINALIRSAPKATTREAMAALETLLQRRDRIAALPTWPLNTAMVSRIVIYGVIPPLAWVLAALVEQLIEALLAGA